MKKEKREQEQGAESSVKAKVASVISSGIIKTQGCWVLFMERCTHRASIKKQKIIFLSGTAVSAFFCLYLVLDGLFGTPHPIEKIAPITPVQLHEDTLRMRKGGDTSLRKFLHGFYRQRDSLKKHAPEEWRWLMENRPGLMDSIARIEALAGEEQQ